MPAAISTCHSGGAKGADLAWGDAARAAGHAVIHWSFEGHWSRAPRKELRVLSGAALAEATPRLEMANRTLRRRVPAIGTAVGNLIHRNWYQVRDSRALYAVSTFERGQVKGGTAWATQMFVDLMGGGPCEAYVFDQESGTWHKWDGAWTPVADVPPPEGPYAGVGTRDINASGMAAIASCYAPPAPAPRDAAPAPAIPAPFRLPPIRTPRR